MKLATVIIGNAAEVLATLPIQLVPSVAWPSFPCSVFCWLFSNRATLGLHHSTQSIPLSMVTYSWWAHLQIKLVMLEVMKLGLLGNSLPISFLFNSMRTWEAGAMVICWSQDKPKAIKYNLKLRARAEMDLGVHFSWMKLWLYCYPKTVLLYRYWFTFSFLEIWIF